ncbi:MAG TPA: PAS domain S-box protein, partial [Spirochaetota bacterium]|nr:PAS domain S-box protein [Spirochaetota bacterium]
MDTKTLQQLSQDELIKLIQQLQLKIDLLQKGVEEEPVDYKKLIEAADDIIFVLDSEGNVVYRNRAMEDLFPVNSKDAVGMHFSLYLPAIELDRATMVFNQILYEGKSIHNEKMKTFDKDGNPVYLMANLAPIKDDDGKITGLFGILRNITEMHLMEKKLKESSRRLEEKIKEQLRQAEELKRLSTLNDEIINNSPIGIFTIDPTGIILSENPAL